MKDKKLSKKCICTFRKAFLRLIVEVDYMSDYLPPDISSVKPTNITRKSIIESCRFLFFVCPSFRQTFHGIDAIVVCQGGRSYVWGTHCRSEYAIQLCNSFIRQQSGKRPSRPRTSIVRLFCGCIACRYLSIVGECCGFIFYLHDLCAFGKAFDPWKKSATMVLIGAVFAGGLLTAFQYRIQYVQFVD